MNIAKSLSDYTVKKVSKYVPLDPKEEAKVIYGLYCFFSNFIKIPLVLILAYFIGLFNQTLTFLFVFVSLRSFSFGMHAEKSWQCTISNFLIFNLGTFIAVNLYISPFIIVSIVIFSFFSFLLYAPADTKARPLKKAHERKKYKIKTLFVYFILIGVLIFTKNYDYKKIITLAMFVQAVNILPLSYYILKKPYRNYLNLNEFTIK